MIKDYRKLKCLHFTKCKCGEKISWQQEFNATREESNDFVKVKFNWTLFPSRCPKCKG